jgi:hypothetical protein
MSQINEHAARLREMAYFEQSKAEEWEMHATSLVSAFGYSHRGCAKAAETCRVTSAALLAGAEALEAVEAAKAELQAEAWKIGNGTPTMDGNSLYRILSGDQHAVATAYKAALARLEGK